MEFLRLCLCILAFVVCLRLASRTVSASSIPFPPHANNGLPNGWVWGCMPGNVSANLPFCDTRRPFDERTEDLLGRLTEQEKMSFLGADTVTTSVDACTNMNHGVPRFGIPPYTNLVEINSAVAASCLADNICATSFASPALLAASFNRSVWRVKGEMISDEQRAFNNYGWHRGVDVPYAKIGLTGFGPNINIVRDPRFGRNSELPSEDPLLSGMYATEYVRALQFGSDPNYVKLIAGLKHFAAYSVETDREAFIPTISNFDLADTYLAQYRLGFLREYGHAYAVMCSYAGVNGVPSCANDFLLNHMIRFRWARPEVFVVTDCGAINNMLSYNHYASSSADASAKTLNGGSDIDLGDSFFPPTAYGGNGGLASALKQNLTDDSSLNEAVKRVLLPRFLTGQFDPLSLQNYTQIPISVVNSTDHQQKNLEMTTQGFVLLKNDENTLPFAEGKNLAVIGPHVYSQRDLQESYNGDQSCMDSTSDCIPTIADIFTRLHPGSTTVQQGVDLYSNDKSGVAAAVAAASKADQVVLCIGIGWDAEHEGQDRTDITLPGIQEQFALQILALGKPTVVVVINGGAVSIDNIIPKAPALIEAFYPGIRGAEGLYLSIFGHLNRFGRLPYSIYPASFQSAQSLTNFDMSAAPGRTYRYYQRPLFAFGFGLSYSKFVLANAQLQYIPDALSFYVSVSVTNQGPNYAGDEIILIYHRVSDAIRQRVSHPVPAKQLVDFTRITLNVNEQRTATFIIQALEGAMLTNNNGEKVLYAGDHYFDVDDGTGMTPLTLTFTITKEITIAFL